MSTLIFSVLGCCVLGITLVVSLSYVILSGDSKEKRLLDDDKKVKKFIQSYGMYESKKGK